MRRRRYDAARCLAHAAGHAIGKPFDSHAIVLTARSAARAFPTVGTRTASVGVTAFRPGDAVAGVAARADAAL